MFARVLTSITCVVLAITYALFITDAFSVQLTHGTPIGMWLMHVPTVALLFVGLIMAINPDWDKAEF